MKYSPAINISFPTRKLEIRQRYSCSEVRKSCLPSFVFSISGQVGFRQALQHLASCNDTECRKLKVKVISAMRSKLSWLLKENVLLGCIHLQPSIYGKNKILFNKDSFAVTAHHLAHCPKESCAQLRRSSLLTVRKSLSPKNERKID